jgi:hypothetical protein
MHRMALSPRVLFLLWFHKRKHIGISQYVRYQ